MTNAAVRAAVAEMCRVIPDGFRHPTTTTLLRNSTTEVVMLAVLFVALFCFVPLVLLLASLARRPSARTESHQQP